MEWKRINRKLERHPARAVIYSFALADIIGAILLWCPFSHVKTLSFIDALFTSTSAICVTGLTVVNTAQDFTHLGQFIILVLMQLGGLGVMTFSVFIALGFKDSLSFSSRLSLQESFLPHFTPEPRKLLFTIFAYTFISEALIALGLFLCFLGHGLGIKVSLAQAIFHAVSAFCNAGFSTFNDGMIDFQKSYAVLALIALAILLGNTGFPIVYELLSFFKEKRHKLSLHFKLTVYTHVALIIFGTVAFLWFDSAGAMAGLSWPLKVVTAVFHSVSARTAGFNSIDIAHFSEHSIYVFLILMVIGACPGSTGGGIKTTTFAVLSCTVWSRLRGFPQAVAFKRSIPVDQVGKAVTLVFIYLLAIMLFHFFLTFTEPNIPFYKSQHEFLGALFEVVSALGTVGLSTGVTSNLNLWGKICIILTMFVGRVGLLSLISFLSEVGHEPRPYRYPKERVMVG
ncbi:H(+)-transporting two-sector ATPase [Thermodesulfatator indicus DSM 15286]|uniref:H(+)-transporting two-sector ATPase n=1 Tax=Thermodesulfatator indicus (strain DSM 15286 / JCM 11887 / CIR29812) TaxID=667014 RepID=F8AD75_THEID|nr:TrkH family potassium uptake protein [Thermodesulfatator indicus]AEH44807.1 H(+)-transporting two-sector ATPase [Thermodesulfatator indicus DSM 15286]